MDNLTCILDDCTTPRYQRHQYCGSHYMKWYRHGDPHYKAKYAFKDLAGKRFGLLTAMERVGNKWRCECDCGEATMSTVGDLNRGSKQSCGIKQRHPRHDIEYGAAHDRVRARQGNVKDSPCIDCGNPASHWSYDHQDPRELVSRAPGTAGIPYSTNPAHYDPRCVSCHKRFDLGRNHAGI